MISSNRALLLIALLMTLVASPSWSASKTEPVNADNLTLATVNEQPVLARDIVSLFNKRHAGHAKFLGGDVEARKFLDIVIEDRLLTQEAYELGLDELPEVRQYVDEYARSQMSRYYVSAEITEKAKTTPEEVKRVYDEQLATFVHGRQIVVASRKEAESIHAALSKGADFDLFARTCSLSDSRRRGGHVMAGWGQFDPEWERVVFKLDPGELSPVMEIGGVFEIIQVTDRITVPRPEFKDVSQKIDDALFRRRLDARKAEVAAALWSKYNARILVSDYSATLLQRLLTTSPKTVVAEFDGGKLTLDEVFEANELATMAAMDPLKGRKAVDDEIRQTVNLPLVALEAKALEMDKVPVVAQELERYRDFVVESVLYRDHIFKDVAVTDEELQQYYDAHKSDFELPEQRRISQIMLLNEEEAKKVAALASAKDADFAELAKKHSRDMVSAASGGDLGWVAPTNVPAAFSEVLKVAIGTVTKPMKSSTGWHVFKVLEEKPRAPQPLDAVREKVREAALDAEKREVRKQWVTKLREASKIRIDDAAIAAFVKANEPSGKPPAQHGM